MLGIASTMLGSHVRIQRSLNIVALDRGHAIRRENQPAPAAGIF